jgi:hypothetical protein
MAKRLDPVLKRFKAALRNLHKQNKRKNLWRRPVPLCRPTQPRQQSNTGLQQAHNPSAFTKLRRVPFLIETVGVRVKTEKKILAPALKHARWAARKEILRRGDTW